MLGVIGIVSEATEFKSVLCERKSVLSETEVIATTVSERHTTATADNDVSRIIQPPRETASSVDAADQNVGDIARRTTDR
jgi:ribosomal silencing factor RsfS